MTDLITQAAAALDRAERSRWAVPAPEPQIPVPPPRQPVRMRPDYAWWRTYPYDDEIPTTEETE